MSKRRASIRGRGAEIVFGEPSPAGSKPRSSEPASSEAAWVGRQTPDTQVPAGKAPVLSEDSEFSLDEPELESALLEEAQTGKPDSEKVEQEPSTEKRASSAAARTAEPTRGDEAGGVLPPRPKRLYVTPGEEDLEGLDIQEPEDRVEPIELPDRQISAEERAQILAWLGDQRIQALETAIDEAYKDVRLKVADNGDIATDCYNKLLRARDLVLRRDVARIAQAEYYLEMVRARLKRVDESDAAAQKYQWRILVWGLFWFATLLTLLIMLNDTWFRQFLLPPNADNTFIDVDIFFSTMIWGGIGGVIAVLYSLFKHVGQRDFDTHYNLSYIGKPFFGAILGAAVYMVFNLLVRSLGIMPLTLEGAGEASTTTIAPGLMYLMAWATGFKENRIFDLVDRQFFSGKSAGKGLIPGTN